MATVGGHTAAGNTAARQANGAGFSRRSTARRIGTATPEHLVPAPVAGAKRVRILRHWVLHMTPRLPFKLRSRNRWPMPMRQSTLGMII